MLKHTDAAGRILLGQAGGAPPAGSQPRGQLPGTAVTRGGGTRGWAPRFMELSFPCSWRLQPFPRPALLTPLGRAHRRPCGHTKEGDFTRLWPGGAPTHGLGHQALFRQAPIITGGETDAQSLALHCA